MVISSLFSLKVSISRLIKRSIYYLWKMTFKISVASGTHTDVYLKPYFLDAYRPVKKGNYFTVCRAMLTVEVTADCLRIILN